MQPQMVCLNISYSHNLTDLNPIAQAPLLKKCSLYSLLYGEAIINADRTTRVQHYY